MTRRKQQSLAVTTVTYRSITFKLFLSKIKKDIKMIICTSWFNVWKIIFMWAQAIQEKVILYTLLSTKKTSALLSGNWQFFCLFLFYGIFCFACLVSLLLLNYCPTLKTISESDSRFPKNYLDMESYCIITRKMI